MISHKHHARLRLCHRVLCLPGLSLDLRHGPPQRGMEVDLRLGMCASPVSAVLPAQDERARGLQEEFDEARSDSLLAPYQEIVS